jgi:methanethiol S-methyltransferase
MFDSTFILYILYILFFLSYFIVHSILASLSFKAWFLHSFPRVTPYYRLFFNLLSIVLFLPLVFLLTFYPGDSLWQWHGLEAWIANLIALFTTIAFLISLSDYDMTEFFGLYPFKKYNKTMNPSPKEHFCLGRFHLYVRHPWYFFLLLLIWTRDMTTYYFLVANLMTLYLIIGSYLEEQKMILNFGKRYQEYRKRVPGLIPLPWKYLTRSEADLLL